MGRIEEEIQKNGFCMFMTEGDSMYPMIKAGNSRVIITKAQFPLKKYDVPVYRRDGHYTMHRIVMVWRGKYWICGDNRVWIERDIEEKDIIGVLQGFYTDGRYTACDDTEYLKYAKRVCRGYAKRWMKHIEKKMAEKVGRKKEKN